MVNLFTVYNNLGKYIGLLAVAFLCTIISCNSPENKMRRPSYIRKANLKKISSYEINIDSLASSLIISYQYFLDTSKNKEYLVVLDNNRNGLIFYNLIDKKMIKFLPLQVEGPKGVGKLDSFFIKSLDSIYVSAGKNFTVTCINFDGEIKRKYKTLTKNYSGTVRDLFSYPSYYINNKIYYGIAPYLNPFSDSFFKKSQLVMSLNLINSSIDYSITYPNIYTKNTYCVQDLFDYATFNYKTFEGIHSFPVDNSLHVYDTLGHEIAVHWAGSDFFENVEPMPSVTQDNNRQFKHFLNNHHYEKVIYDQFRDVYYRYAVHPTGRGDKYINTDVPSLRFSIIILDNKFNKIGETMLPLYLQNSCVYVNSKGLYLQSIPKDDNKVTFHLLTLSYEKI